MSTTHQIPRKAPGTKLGMITGDGSVLSRSKQIARTALATTWRMLTGDVNERASFDHGKLELFLVVAAPVDPDETAGAGVRGTGAAARHAGFRTSGCHGQPDTSCPG